MGGRVALGAEVVHAFDEAGSEELLPEAVHGDACGERVLLREEPLCEIKARVGLLLWQGWEHFGGCSRHLVLGFVVLAALHDVRLAGLWEVRHDESGWDGVCEGLFFRLEGNALGFDFFDERSGLGVDVFEPPILDPLGVLFSPLFGLFPANDVLQVSGQVGHASSLVFSFPNIPGPCGVIGWVGFVGERESVPEHGSVELGEGEAVHLHTGFESEFVGIELEAGPFPGFWEFAEQDFFSGVGFSEGDGFVLAPDGAVVPAAGVELHHDGLGWGCGVELAPHREGAVCWDVEGGAFCVKVLCKSGCGALEGPFSRVHRSLFGADKRGGTSGVLDLGTCGEVVIEPDGFFCFGGWRRIEGCGVCVLDFCERFANGLLLFGDRLVDLFQFGFLFWRSELQDGWSEEDVPVHGRIRCAVEEGVHRVEILGRDGIELVVVADGAACGESHPDGHGGFGAIDGIAEEPFLADGTAFAGGHIAAVETGGDALFAGGVWEEVSCELPDGEPVE